MSVGLADVSRVSGSDFSGIPILALGGYSAPSALFLLLLQTLCSLFGDDRRVGRRVSGLWIGFLQVSKLESFKGNERGGKTVVAICDES